MKCNKMPVEAARIVRGHMAFNTSNPWHVNPEAYHEICHLAGVEKHHPYHEHHKLEGN